MHVRHDAMVRVEELEEEVAQSEAIRVAADNNVVGGILISPTVR